MSITPFSMRPTSPDGESRRTRLVLVIAIAGIAATLLAYALSAGVRHAVGHAEHSVKHAVGHVFDRDEGAHARAKHPARPASRGKATQPGRSTAPPQGHTKAEGG